MTPRRAAQDLLKAIGGTRLVELDGSGHAMMAEKPDEVLEALRAFLAKAREAA
jgi:pimeloyl-ACP methyl ester carboxylesterase